MQSIPQHQLAQALFENCASIDYTALSLAHFGLSAVGTNTKRPRLALEEARICLSYVDMLPAQDDAETVRVAGLAYAIIGAALIENKDYNEAIPYLHKAIALFKQLPGQTVHLNFIVFCQSYEAHCLLRNGGEERIGRASQLMEELLVAREQYFAKTPTFRYIPLLCRKSLIVRNNADIGFNLALELPFTCWAP